MDVRWRDIVPGDQFVYDNSAFLVISTDTETDKDKLNTGLHKIYLVGTDAVGTVEIIHWFVVAERLINCVDYPLLIISAQCC